MSERSAPSYNGITKATKMLRREAGLLNFVGGVVELFSIVVALAVGGLYIANVARGTIKAGDGAAPVLQVVLGCLVGFGVGPGHPLDRRPAVDDRGAGGGRARHRQEQLRAATIGNVATADRDRAVNVHRVSCGRNRGRRLLRAQRDRMESADVGVWHGADRRDRGRAGVDLAGRDEEDRTVELSVTRRGLGSNRIACARAGRGLSQGHSTIRTAFLPAKRRNRRRRHGTIWDTYARAREGRATSTPRETGSGGCRPRPGGRRRPGSRPAPRRSAGAC
jgi:hypothetical protein